MLTLAIPIVLQNLISIGLNMADTVMIGKLGVDELAAVGTANRVYFIFSTINFGIYSGAAVYVSQYWGVRDVKNIRRTFGIDIMLGVIVSMFFTLAALLFAPQILTLFTREQNVIDLGCRYLRIVALSYFFTSMTFAISFNSRAAHLRQVRHAKAGRRGRGAGHPAGPCGRVCPDGAERLRQPRPPAGGQAQGAVQL